MITYVQATADDFDKLLALRTTVMAEDFKRHEIDVDRTKYYFAKAFQPQYTSILMIENDEIGCVSVQPGEGGEDELKHFYLYPKFQGYGYGTDVLKRIIREQRKNGRNLTLHVFKGSEAIPLYKKHGFNVVEVGDFTERLRLSVVE
ncbi:acetyltransferase, GNAT family [Geomicrobium sp. JCM 19037]|uniref:GNAT family N-acetyltransferase n=1 Tax=unclassified Geomicrobium TaxID=2628951 RepID=UPI00045F37AD|nr:GNAT family N-acetyltransferase [Geomicrobium sp. JCM 19037]GAK05846.1 acetyltransferase, GNAT family [Geomicrobium sp. JCM 19037]